jgi:hypothetical protein
MMEDIVVLAVLAACLQGLFLSSLYFFSKKHRNTSNRILGLFLLSLIIEAVNSFFPYEFIGEYSIGAYFGLPEEDMTYILLVNCVDGSEAEKEIFKAVLPEMFE